MTDRAPFTSVTSRLAKLVRDDVDTDQIIPARFLKATGRAGFGAHLFADWRASEAEFPLDSGDARGASLLLAGRNFGCGSSREHAPWALLGAGFRAVVARSFGDIFRQNSLKNGLLPVAIDDATHAALVAWEGEVTADLVASELRFGERTARFEVDAFSRDCLMRGVDELGALLARLPEIEAFERRQA
ncbi:MAG: 3-isopropylmalate dehydratase small subunit [Polyangiaceae bacterium]|nr:3-isopropylmalate dehydratase small subunit [Polyangiaceae bacterium]